MKHSVYYKVVTASMLSTKTIKLLLIPSVNTACSIELINQLSVEFHLVHYQIKLSEY